MNEISNEDNFQPSEYFTNDYGDNFNAQKDESNDESKKKQYGELFLQNVATACNTSKSANINEIPIYIIEDKNLQVEGLNNLDLNNIESVKTDYFDKHRNEEDFDLNKLTITSDNNLYATFSTINQPKIRSFTFEYNKKTCDNETLKAVLFIIRKEPKNIYNHSTSLPDSTRLESKKEYRKKNDRFDEVIKNIKSKAYKKYLAQIKSLVKGKTNSEEIKLLLTYMRELFVVDTNKLRNFAKLECSILDILKGTKQDLIKAIEQKQKNIDIEKSLTKLKKMYLKKNKMIIAFTSISKLNFDNLEKYFSDKKCDKILNILNKTYSEIITEFSKSLACKKYKEHLIFKMKKSEKYMNIFDAILKNLKFYLKPDKKNGSSSNKIEYNFYS